ncbi:hypothetical protein MESS4_310010 [Mesorhizobium sp. STM 4661]|nr:hypothetical protein MESS4_310010 [Mesorhizobium sp. STM 4661]
MVTRKRPISFSQPLRPYAMSARADHSSKAALFLEDNKREAMDSVRWHDKATIQSGESRSQEVSHKSESIF